MIGRLSAAAQKLQKRNLALETELQQEKARQSQSSDELAAVRAKLKSEENARLELEMKVKSLAEELTAEVCSNSGPAFAFTPLQPSPQLQSLPDRV